MDDVGLAVFSDDEEWVPPDPELMDWPDPGSGPPDGEDAWLADLALPQLDALAEELAAARPAARESVWAGFTHRPAAAGITAGEPGWEPEYVAPTPTGPAQGFAAGGPLDVAAADPVLAEFAQEVLDDGLAGLSDDQLVGLLCAARRMASWQSATELAAAAELAARRQRDAAAGQDAVLNARRSSETGEHVAAELAAALTLTGRAAGDLLDLALGLARLRPVLAALSTGSIDLPKSRVFAAELGAVGDVAANRIALSVLDRAPGWTTGQLRRALRIAVLTEDPAAARRRADAARDDARVETWQEGSGNGALAGRELPAADTIAANARISQIARALKNGGAIGTMDQLRAGVYLALLLGRNPLDIAPAGRDPVIAAQPGREPLNTARAGRDPLDMAGAGQDARPGTGHATGCLDGVINLTLPALTWLGLADRPGELSGFGPLDPFTCRDLSDMLAARGTATWHVTLTNAAGQAVAHACARGQPPVPVPPHEINAPGATQPDTGPPGAAPPGTGPPGTGPPGAVDPRVSWLAGLRFDWLERGDCGHSREAASYQPGTALRHLLTIRNPTCTAPGCRRPAARCDNEHTIPFDAGGRTCECNCAPMCRRDHRCKQASGWAVTQPSPGVLVWTTPAGRRYVTQPDSYPV